MGGILDILGGFATNRVAQELHWPSMSEETVNNSREINHYIAVLNKSSCRRATTDIIQVTGYFSVPSFFV